MKIKIFSVLLIVVILFWVLWPNSLNINLVVEKSYHSKLDMVIKFDNAIIFNDSVLQGTYNRGEIKLLRVANGFHDFEVITKLGKAKYSTRMFVMFRRNLVIEYYNGDSSQRIPYFKLRKLFTEFYPD